MRGLLPLIRIIEVELTHHNLHHLHLNKPKHHHSLPLTNKPNKPPIAAPKNLPPQKIQLNPPNKILPRQHPTIPSLRDKANPPKKSIDESLRRLVIREYKKII
jgi:hypothetical protein